jgi:hypothetical protein
MGSRNRILGRAKRISDVELRVRVLTRDMAPSAGWTEALQTDRDDVDQAFRGHSSPPKLAPKPAAVWGNLWEVHPR